MAHKLFIFQVATLAAGCVLFAPSVVLAQTSGRYAFTNFVGQTGGVGNEDGTGCAAGFNYPNGVAVDRTGNVYVADRYNHTIRKVATNGVVSTLAGSAGQTGAIDATGSSARFNNPIGIAVDGGGTVYIADCNNHTIRKVTSSGSVTTLAGSAGLSGSANGTGAAARFNYPGSVAVDGTGNLVVADYANCTIRRVTTNGVVTTLAGSAGLTGSANGTGSAARFSYPNGVTVDSGGTVYVADRGNHTIRKVTSAGVVTTLAGSAGVAGSADGAGSTARFNTPYAVAVDSTGDVFVADYGNGTVRRIGTNGMVSTFAGSAGFFGSTDATGSAARFNGPAAIVVDGNGNSFVADYPTCTIRAISPLAAVTTLAGNASRFGSANGTGCAAAFNCPNGVAVDRAGNLYVADRYNHTIRKVTTSGVVSTLAGSAGQTGAVDAAGGGARFNNPIGIAVDGGGAVYVADCNNHTIRKVTSGGSVTTLAGSAGVSGSANGTGTAARFNYPGSVAVDDTGNLVVADYANCTIRRVTTNGVVTTLAGSAGLAGSANGTGSAARFSYPNGVTVDSGGNVYVADRGNHTIRKVTSGGVVTTLAGSAGLAGSDDGAGSTARFNTPYAVAVDSAGNVFVADYGNSTIRQIATNGTVSTPGGTPGLMGPMDGVGTAARFAGPAGIAVDSLGVLYIADYGNNRISIGSLALALLTPKLNWENPAAVTYGATLGAGQLNATANVLGAFFYDPPAGAALNAGTNTLTVQFVPADTNDFSSVSGQASLVVLRSALSVTANNATRLYGETNPPFSGTIIGLTNADNVTAAYDCSATISSPPGTYSIVPQLVDPDNRLVNYLVSTNNGLLSVVSPPRIDDVAFAGGLLNFSWNSTVGSRYQVQCKDALEDAVWRDFGPEVTATAILTTTSDSITNKTRFYRVVLLR